MNTESLELRLIGVTSTIIRVDMHPHVLAPTAYAMTFGKLLCARDLAGKRVLDIGCGSGILSIVAATQGAEVWAVDISPAALEMTEQNARRNDVSLSRVVESDTLKSFLPGGVHHGERFDLVVCNNPSLPGRDATDRDRSNYIEWNENGDGREVLDAILKNGRDILTSDGSLITHTSSEQKWELTARLLSENWPDWETLLAMETSVDSEYYDDVRAQWLAEGSAYVKRGRILHLVTLFEAYAEARELHVAGEDKLLGQRLIREVLDL